jgi:hypothetical protein
VNCLGPRPLTPPTHGVELAPEIRGRCVVTLNGADVTGRTISLRTGAGGWVELCRVGSDGRRHRCSGICQVGDHAGDHMAVEYWTGDVNLIVEPA